MIRCRRLTATALRVLAEAREGVSDLYLTFQVPAETVNKAALWLSRQKDKSGAFQEVNYEYNRRYQVTLDCQECTTPNMWLSVQ